MFESVTWIRRYIGIAQYVVICQMKWCCYCARELSKDERGASSPTISVHKGLALAALPLPANLLLLVSV